MEPSTGPHPFKNHLLLSFPGKICQPNNSQVSSQLFITPYFSAKLNDLQTLYFYKEYPFWASLVAQWLRICLPMQGTRVRALVWEDPT